MSEEMTPGRIAAEAHDRSLFGDATPVPWGEPDNPAVIAWEAGAEAIAAPLRAEIGRLLEALSMASDMQFTPIGYQGPTAHTYTAACAGRHPISEPCPPPAGLAVVQVPVDPARIYPHQDGDLTVIGPECFTGSAGQVISWRGENYYRAETATEPDGEPAAAGTTGDGQQPPVSREFAAELVAANEGLGTALTQARASLAEMERGATRDGDVIQRLLAAGRQASRNPGFGRDVLRNAGIPVGDPGDWDAASEALEAGDA